MNNHTITEMKYTKRESTVLVTGAAGFIGSNLTNALAEDGHYVIALDDESFGTFDNLDDSPYIQPMKASVLDDIPAEWFQEFDTIYHLAAKSSTKMHEDDPRGGARVNIEGFINIMEKAEKAGVEDVVYASSSTVYGNPDTPTGEDEPYDALACYPASKIAREQYANVYRGRGMNVVGARFYSTYQGYRHQEGHKGEHGNVISMFVDDMAQGDRPVVYQDGEQTRNFTHVDDVVAGLRAMAGENGVYNVCTDSPNTFNEVVDAINRALGTDIEAEYVEPQLEGEYISVQEGDSTKLQSETGWTPMVGLVDGIQRVCEPYLNS